VTALNAGQVSLIFSDGSCERTALYVVKNATAGDTFDIGADFAVVKRAGIVSATGTTIAAVTTIAGTTLTVPAGPTNDGLWLLVVGVAV
jgi:hypothetical protein